MTIDPKKSKGLRAIQKSIEDVESHRRREHFKQRLDLARVGVNKFKEKKLGEAASAFYTYLRVVEDWKGVPENGLTPTLFDRQKEYQEILLINGVYWDLAIMYDRTSSDQKTREFLQYLEKFVLFSKGLPHEHVAAETIRRYILKGRPKHRKAFSNAYRAITGSSCFIATSLIDVCDEATLPRLREFRDTRLNQNYLGRLFVRTYYRVGPRLAKVLDECPDPVRVRVGRLLDLIANQT